MSIFVTIVRTAQYKQSSFNLQLMKKSLFVIAAALVLGITAKAQVFGTGNVPQVVLGVGYSPAYTHEAKEEGYTDNVAPFMIYQAAYEGTMFGVLARYGKTSFERVEGDVINNYNGNLFFVGGSMCVNLGGSRFGVDSHIPGMALEYRQSELGTNIGFCFYGSIRAHFYITRKVAIYAEAMGLVSKMQNYVQPVAGIAIQL